MKCSYHNGWYYLRVPGAILRSRNKDLLWPSYMAVMINMPKEIREAQRTNITLRFRCEP